jgi:hypothetical protein
MILMPEQKLLFPSATFCLSARSLAPKVLSLRMHGVSGELSSFPSPVRKVDIS